MPVGRIGILAPNPIHLRLIGRTTNETYSSKYKAGQSGTGKGKSRFDACHGLPTLTPTREAEREYPKPVLLTPEEAGKDRSPIQEL